MDDAQEANERQSSHNRAPNSVPDVTGGTSHTGPGIPEAPTALGKPSATATAANAGPTAADGAAPKPASSLAKQLIGVAVAGVFLWLAFRGIDLGKVWASIQTVNTTWIVALLVSTIISHWLRAVRWVIMLQPLANHKISTWNSFCAVMFGYAVNIPIPRGGEVARVVAISKSEKIPWAGVVPTLLIDRLLDFALLVCFVGLTLAIMPPEFKARAAFLVPAGVMMCVGTIVGLALLPKAAAIIRAVVALPMLAAKLPERLKDTALRMAEQFDQGTRSLSNPTALPAIAALSFAIWGFYFLNFYCTLAAFGLNDKIQLARSIVIWTISSVSVIAPTPGCVGTFHVAAKEALHIVGNVDETQALAVATLLHAISFVVVPCVVAFICFLIQDVAPKRASKESR